MWLANALTLSRIPLACLVWLTYSDREWTLALVAVAALTDALDGTIARRARARGQHGTAGEWLDPAADKIFVVVVLAAAVAYGDASLGLVALVCARELVLLPLAAVYRLHGPRRPHAFQADALGKATTIAQLAAVVSLVMRQPFAPALAVLAGGLGVAAAAHYVGRSVTPRTNRYLDPRASRSS